MKAKELVCNDCGCRFEIKEAKAPAPEAAAKEKAGEGKTRPAGPSCPECRSYNITTA